MKTFDGYKKRTLTDEYALLAGGGHKPLSDFSMAHNHPYLPLAGGTMTGSIGMGSDATRWLITTGTNGANSPLRGIKMPATASSWLGLFARPSKSTDEGGLLLSEDTCVIYNSFDTGYGLAVYDTDMNLSDWSGNLAFGINSSYQAWAKGGFIKNGSDNTYILLGGGDHKAVSDFATSTQGSHADTAYGWGNHANAGYLTAHQSLARYVKHIGNKESDWGSSAPAAKVIEYWESDSLPLNTVQFAYDRAGYERTILLSKGANTSYGSILAWGQSSYYLWFLNKEGGNWNVNNWTKIYAGYADSAGKTSKTLTFTGGSIATFNGSTDVSVAIPTSLPASDVYNWAKQPNKPTYSFSEITPGVATIGDGSNRLIFRTNESYRNGIYYSTPGNEALVFSTKYSVTSWIFATTDPNSQTAWTSLTPSLQIKNGRVTINKLIANDTNASYNLDVNGSANATTLYENGIRVSVSGHTHNYLPLSGGWMDKDSIIYFRNPNNGETSPYAAIGYKTGVTATMHANNSHQGNGAFYIWSNGSTTANDNGGLAIDNEGVTVFGAGDNASNFSGVFRVLNEDNVADGPLFLVTKSSGCTCKYNMTAANFYSSSDIRLKNNINNISKSIRSFNWNDTGLKSYGLIAQEIEDEYPELVSNNDNGYKSINYTSALCMIIAKLENELDELRKRINLLQTPPPLSNS